MGIATECTKNKNYKDVRINDLDGGELFSLVDPNAQALANIWKGCSQASSHATNEYNHPPVDDWKELPAALTVILSHLQRTIYNQAGKNLCDCVLKARG
jgi:hypothetical protein